MCQKKKTPEQLLLTVHYACSSKPYQIRVCKLEIFVILAQNCHMTGSIRALKRHCLENTTY